MLRALVAPLLPFLLALPLAAQSPRLDTSRPLGAELLKLPKEDDCFGFVVFGDRTGGPAEGIKVLAQAVTDTNLLDPDLVMTVGDLVQGYNGAELWRTQAAEFKDTMAKLRMPWFPVAGNHDVYWRGAGKPVGEHEHDFETTFGPLWYAVEHKHCWFVALYSDEGNPATGEKNFRKPECQRMSEAQFNWLAATLQKAKGARHVFVFLHHPRWLAQYGDDWQRVHDLLAKNGNVSAVFAGHIHHMRYDGKRDGIEYYTVASVGAELGMEAPQVGFLHQFHVVTVRPEGFTVAALPVGATIDPQRITGDMTEDALAIHGRQRLEVKGFVAQGAAPTITAEGAVDGILTLGCNNPAQRAIEVQLLPRGDGYEFTPDHQHAVIAPGGAAEVTFAVRRAASPTPFVLPQVELRCDYLATDRRIALPSRLEGIELPPPATLGEHEAPFEGALQLDGTSACVTVPALALDLPDGPFTLECWLRGDDFSGRRGLLAKTENSEYALFGSDGGLDFSVWLGDGYVSARTKSAVLTPGGWHHVAGVFDGNEVRCYLDGRLLAATQGKGKRKTNELPLVIGGDPDRTGKPGSFVTGAIDEVRLSKVARYVGKGFEPARRHDRDADTVLLLHLDRDFGPWAADSSGRDNHGRRVGTAHCTVERRDAAR
ncbi:MAG: metallophosphoesterase [Planctomycetes bacterium]|nr:metallophosphoesterase [Planctomycetota bacterium]